MKLKTLVLSLCSASALAFAAHAETITIATVNNGDMIRMQKLTDDFTVKNPCLWLFQRLTSSTISMAKRRLAHCVA